MATPHPPASTKLNKTKQNQKHVGPNEEAAICKPRKKALEETISPNCLILVF